MLLDTPLATGNALRFASASSDDEAIRFIESRLLVYLRLMGTLFGAMYVVGIVLFLVLAPNLVIAAHLHPSKLVNLALTIVPFALSAWITRGSLSLGLLFAIDAAFTLCISIGIGYATAQAPSGYHLELGALLVLVLSLVLRAAIVPSTFLRTALIGIASSPAIVVGGYVQAAKAEPIISFVTLPVIAIVLAVWCLAATGASAIVSRVVYGLVRQVRQAMRLGQYTLGEKVGKGGMGEVYRAAHAMLRRPTAVKLLLPDRVGAESLARFEREVRLTSELSHPNTVAIYDYGRTPNGVFYYAMEYLEGPSLEKLVADEGPQPAARVVHILSQMASSLSEAHAAGLIHRDVKPGNVILCTRGGIPEFVKVIDFGLVKRIDGGADLTLTHVDALTGTPLFMAPECTTQPHDVDSSIDTYALGAVGYFLVTGTPPFDGRTLVEVCGHHLHTKPTPPSERLGRSVPLKLEGLLLRCLAKDPKERPTDRELESLLAACRSESHAPRPSFAARELG